MAYCSNCGQKIADGAKFCPGCGTEVTVTQQDTGKRTQTYAGEIRKCPNCGEVLSAFEATCHACGFELRNIKATTSTQELANKIAEIESERRKTNSSMGKSLLNRINLTDTSVDTSIANIIRSWAVPNTKEDICEFMALAAANINPELVGTNAQYSSQKDKSQKIQCEAWFAKFEQVYTKAKLSFGNSPEFSQIKEIYDQKHFELKEPERKRRKMLIGLAAFWVILIILSLVISAINSPSKKDSSSNDKKMGYSSEQTLQDSAAEVKEAIEDVTDVYKDTVDEYKDTVNEYMDIFKDILD